MAATFSVKTDGIEHVAADLFGLAKESDLAGRFALKRVGEMARTRVTRSAAKHFGVKQAPIRKRIRVFPQKTPEPSVKVWAGTAARLRAKEVGRAKMMGLAPSGSFWAKMRSGHEGVFYRSVPGAPKQQRIKRVREWPAKDLPIAEASMNIAPLLNRVIPKYVNRMMSRRYDDIYWRDFKRRADKKGKGRRRRR